LEGTNSLGFGILLLVNAVLFIRPTEIVPELEGWPIYEAAILTCLVFSFPAVLRLLAPSSLIRQPITVCVLGLLPAIVLSHLTHFNLFSAREGAIEFCKVVIYYLLLLANVSSPARLRQFLAWLVGLIVVLTALAVLQYHHVIDIPSLTEYQQRAILEQTGEEIVIPRLMSAGLFNDPNDLCLILLSAAWISLFWIGAFQAGLPRWLWLAPLGLFGYALMLTQSRGGFLALLAGVFALIRSRFGWGKTGLLGVLVVPILFFVYAGRQTSIDIGNRQDTAQSRIHLWAEAIQMFKEAPAFGIGKDEFQEATRIVVHNGFLHSFTELGFVGGTMFLGCFCCAGWMLVRLASTDKRWMNPALYRFRPFLLAIVASYAMGLMSLSRSYVVTTYLILGLVTAYVRLREQNLPGPLLLFNLRLIGRLAICTVVFLGSIYFCVRLFAQWS
jgi:O-antigen ligase